MKKLLKLLFVTIMMVCAFTTQAKASGMSSLTIEMNQDGQYNGYMYTHFEYEVEIENLEPESIIQYKKRSQYGDTESGSYQADLSGKFTLNFFLDNDDNTWNTGNVIEFTTLFHDLAEKVRYKVTQKPVYDIMPSCNVYDDNAYNGGYSSSTDEGLSTGLREIPNGGNSKVVFTNYHQSLSAIVALKVKVDGISGWSTKKFDLYDRRDTFNGPAFTNIEPDTDITSPDYGWATFYPIYRRTDSYDGELFAVVESGTNLPNYFDFDNNSDSNILIASTSGGAKTNQRLVNSETIRYNVKKVWDDDSTASNNKRPYGITVFIKDAESDEIIDSAYMPMGWFSNEYTHQFIEVPVYKGIGNTGDLYSYVVGEEPVPGYELVSNVYDGTFGGYVLTNKPAVPQTINVIKVWDDNDNYSGCRPESITLRLHANGVEVDSATVSASNNYSYSFTNKPRLDNFGNPILYTVTEDEVLGYMPSFDTDETTPNVVNITLTNKHEHEKIAVTVEKEWLDDDNQENTRPTYVTVKLLQDGVETGDTLVLNDANNWEGVFGGLEYYKPGLHTPENTYKYTVTEVPVDGYVTDVTGTQEQGYVIVNTHNKVHIDVLKVWNDNDDENEKRPESVTVDLLANGTKINSVTLSEVNHWYHRFTNLPIYTNEHDPSTEITYTVVENDMYYYDMEVLGNVYSGFEILNTYNPSDVPPTPPTTPTPRPVPNTATK